MTGPLWVLVGAVAVLLCLAVVRGVRAVVRAGRVIDAARADDLLPDEPVPYLPLPWPHDFDPINCAVCAGIAARERFAAASERIRRMLREEAERQCSWSEQDDAAVARLLDGAS